MNSQTFGEKIKELRINKGLSLKNLGEQVGYSARHLSKIEKNEKQAPLELVKALSKTLQVNHKDLITKYLTEKIYYQIKDFEYPNEVLESVKKRVFKEGQGTTKKQSRQIIFESIKNYFSNKPVEKAYVFGSFAKASSISQDSDIDILVVFKKPNTITLFDLIEMKEELSKKTGRAIDLVEEGQELESFKPIIQKEKVLVYAS